MLPAERGHCRKRLMDDANLACRRSTLTPGIDQQRPARLIQINTVAEEGTSQDGLLQHTELLERAVAATVSDGGLGLHPMHVKRVEREIENEVRGVHEDARAPKRGTQRESPFSGMETRRNRADLEQTDDGVGALDRHSVGNGFALVTLADRPGDELLETFDGGRRRRNEPCDFGTA